MVTAVSPQRPAVDDRCAGDDENEKNRQAQFEHRHCDDSAFETLLESYRTPPAQVGSLYRADVIVLLAAMLFLFVNCPLSILHDTFELSVQFAHTIAIKIA